MKGGFEMKLVEKLMKVCKELEDAKWLEDKCRLPTDSGYIDIKTRWGRNLIVERSRNVEAPWGVEYTTVTLMDVKNIRKTEYGIEAETDSGYLQVWSKWIPSDYAWGPHYHSNVYVYDKNLTVRI